MAAPVITAPADDPHSVSIAPDDEGAVTAIIYAATGTAPITFSLSGPEAASLTAFDNEDGSGFFTTPGEVGLPTGLYDVTLTATNGSGSDTCRFLITSGTPVTAHALTSPRVPGALSAGQSAAMSACSPLPALLLGG